MEAWTSSDAGRTWQRSREITRQSPRNHNYARRPLFAKEPFMAFWSDGNTYTFSESHLYFCSGDGSRLWRLPYKMTDDFSTPEEVEQAERTEAR